MRTVTLVLAGVAGLVLAPWFASRAGTAPGNEGSVLIGILFGPATSLTVLGMILLGVRQAARTYTSPASRRGCPQRAWARLHGHRLAAHIGLAASSVGHRASGGRRALHRLVLPAATPLRNWTQPLAADTPALLRNRCPARIHNFGALATVGCPRQPMAQRGSPGPARRRHRGALGPALRTVCSPGLLTGGSTTPLGGVSNWSSTHLQPDRFGASFGGHHDRLVWSNVCALY